MGGDARGGSTAHVSRLRFRTVCPHDCPDTCSVVATVDNGRVVAVQGDPEHPFTRGFLCAKVNRYPERVHSPERIVTPLRRDGPKGSGKFRSVSWEQALDEIVERWEAIRRQWGSEAILAYVYSGHMGLVSRNLPRALFCALGATQVRTGTVCDTAAEAGWEASYGAVAPVDPESVEQADLIVAWGSDPVTSNVHLVPFIERARRRGARLVVIAPYRNRTARRADHFIAVRVATDGALALGVAHVLFRDGRADLGFLRREAEGWERWADEVVPRYPPARVEALTGVPAGQVEELARWLSEARAPFIRIGTSLGRHRWGGQTVRLVALLAAVLGAWGKPGAGAFLESAQAFPLDYEALRRPDLAPRPLREVNQAQLGRALTELSDPPIRAFFVMANNPAVTCPNAGLIRRGLLREDLFTVVHDTFMTDTAELADIVLPATTAMESDDVYRSYGHLYMQYAPALIPPVGEARPNAWVVGRLARRLGLDDPVFHRSMEDHVRALLPAYPELAERLLRGEIVKFTPTGGPGRWGTPGGRIRFTPLPDYIPDVMPEGAGDEASVWGTGAGAGATDRVLPAKAADAPLRLLTAPGHWLSHTGFEGVEALRRRAGSPRCFIHPEEARARGIGGGDAVELFNALGSVGLYAEVSEDVPPGVVVEGLRPGRAYLTGDPINVLTSDQLADMGGGATFHSTWVRLRVRPAARASST